MSIQDPISDMFTIIRNGQLSKKNKVRIIYSNYKKSILKVLLMDGFIKMYKIIIDVNKKVKKYIFVYLKYFSGIPVISEIKRVSRPGLRIYKSYKLLPVVISGLGIVIVSTSKGVMSSKLARSCNLGGEVIGYVS